MGVHMYVSGFFGFAPGILISVDLVGMSTNKQVQAPNKEEDRISRNGNAGVCWGRRIMVKLQI